MTRVYDAARPAPPHLILNDYIGDTEVGMLKAGKEAEVWVLERTARDGRRCLLADKRYLSPDQRAFRNDVVYRAHRREWTQVRDGGDMRRRTLSRQQRAMDSGTRFGREALHTQWVATEYGMLQTLWDAGAPVPYPVAFTGDGIVMEYLGDADAAAPRLAQARLERPEIADLAQQARDALLVLARAGLIHADLSPYNVLVWRGRLVVIDLPQAVPYLDNPSATDLLHRDCMNLFGWFARKGVPIDPEDVFVEAINILFERGFEDLFQSHGS